MGDTGADDYTWFGINGFENPIEMFNPGYASTGTDISELTVVALTTQSPWSVGSIPYIIPGSGTFASCFIGVLTSAPRPLNLNFPSSMIHPGAVFCEGGTVDFLDLNEGDAPSSTSYSFFATTGLELDNVPSSQTSFEVIADSCV